MKQLGKQLLMAKPVSRGTFHKGINMDDLDMYTDKNLGLNARRFQLLNKKVKWASMSDECFTEFNVFSVMFYALAMIMVAVMIDKLLVMSEAESWIWVLAGIGFCYGCYVSMKWLLSVIIHDNQKVAVNTLALRIMCILGLLVSLLLTFTGLDVSICLFVGFSFVRACCYPANYYTRKEEYL